MNRTEFVEGARDAAPRIAPQARETFMQRWNNAIVPGVALAGVLMGGGEAVAAPESSENALVDRIEALEAQLAELLIVQDEAAAAAAPKAGPGVDGKWDNGFKFANADKSIAIKVGGRIMWDANFFQEDRDTRLLGVGKQLDGVEARRARLYMSGTLHTHFFFKAQYDFATLSGGAGAPGFKDVYLGVKKLGLGDYVKQVRVGHQYMPFGLEEETSSKYITFMERGLTGAITIGRDTGIRADGAVAAGPATIGYALGGYKSVGNWGTAATDGEYGVAARVRLHFPFGGEDSKDRYLHLGASYGIASPTGGTIRMRDPRELHMKSRNSSTGTFAVDQVTRMGGDVIFTFGSISLQAEVARAVFEQPSGVTTNDPEPWAAYAFISWFATGEYRPYKNGFPGRVKPKSNLFDGGLGAIELVARYSHLDTRNPGIGGGASRLNNGTLGVNWYWTPFTRVMVNYLYEDATYFGVGGRIHGLGIRFQIDF